MEGKKYDPLLGFIEVEQVCAGPVPAEETGSSPGDGAGAEADVEPQPTDEAILAAHAANLRDRSGPAFAYPLVASSIAAGIAPEAFIEFRQQFLKDCGSPKDPLVILMVDQVLIANFAVGRLHFRSVTAKTSDAAVAYANCAAHLLGELRRSVLALDVLRSKQAAQRRRSASTGSVEKAASVGRNGKPRPSTNGKKPSNGKQSPNRKKKAADSKLISNGEIPHCLKDRMQPPAPAALQPAGATGRNGRR